MTINKSKLSIAMGTVLVASMAASAGVSAAQNPFTVASLDKGYLVAAADMAKDGKMKEAKCGEGKCGASKAKDAKMDTKMDTKADSKMKDGKCGEGKCGAAKK